jgi:hypothetical protein
VAKFICKTRQPLVVHVPEQGSDMTCAVAEIAPLSPMMTRKYGPQVGLEVGYYAWSENDYGFSPPPSPPGGGVAPEAPPTDLHSPTEVPPIESVASSEGAGLDPFTPLAREVGKDSDETQVPAPGEYPTIDDDPAEYWESEGGDGASESAAYRSRPPVTGSVGYSPYTPVPAARVAAIFGPGATPAPVPLPVNDDENVAGQPDVTASEFMPLLLRVSESVQRHDEFMNTIASQMQQQQQDMQRAFDRRDQAEAERERVREAQRSREAAEREELERARSASLIDEMRRLLVPLRPEPV